MRKLRLVIRIRKVKEIPGYPSEEGEITYKDIPGYEFIKTITDKDGNTVHVYRKRSLHANKNQRVNTS